MKYHTSIVRRAGALLRSASPHARAAAIALAILGSASGAAARAESADEAPPGPQLFPDRTGVVGTLSVNGLLNERSAFFESLGTNGRTCATCHVASQAMSLSAQGIQLRFALTRGKDPLFAAVDGANCPSARSDNAADHSLLLSHGLIRIFLPLPANAQFAVSVVHDPYGCAMVPGPADGQPIISVYRRPLPTTNLNFLSTIMFDGRETHAPLNNGPTFLANLNTDLTQQALDAITIHAQASQSPTPAELADIVGFELGLFSSQVFDADAGLLSAQGAVGGAVNLADEPYYPGVNDSLGADPAGTAFNPASMTLFAAWSNLYAKDSNFIVRPPSGRGAPQNRGRRSALQQRTRADLQECPRLERQCRSSATRVRSTGTCTTSPRHPECRKSPRFRYRSISVGRSLRCCRASSRIRTSPRRLPSSRCRPSGLSHQRLSKIHVQSRRVESFYTTDPGKALISGLCNDFNRGKGPILQWTCGPRAGHYNGAAASLDSS